LPAHLNFSLSLSLSLSFFPLQTENRNWKRDSCTVSQSSGPPGLLIELLETGIPRSPARSNIAARISLSVLPLRGRTIQRRSLSAGSIVRVRARAFIPLPLIYLIHSRFYLVPRTCVNSCARYGTTSVAAGQHTAPSAINTSTRVQPGKRVPSSFSYFIYNIILSNYSLTFTDINSV